MSRRLGEWASRRLGAVLVAASLAACATNPVTGKKEISLVSEGQEVSMGQEAAKEVEQSIGLVDDQQLQAYVRNIGNRLAAASERPQLPWRFGVVDDPTPNAFALPGGPIYITRGLMDMMDSEAELATVLGHEIGHVTARHTASMITKSQLLQVAGVASMILVPQLQNFGGLLSTGLQLLTLKYGRDAERQADELGFKYALGQNYDVSEMADVFKALQRVGEKEGASGIPAWMSTHPDPGERIKTAETRVAALPAPPAPRVENRSGYMARIDHVVYGENPRQGFFRNNEFLHPDLRFRLAFPNGWKTQNLPQAVVAVSPNKDAMLQMTFAQGSPNQAAQNFFSQQGIVTGRNGATSINGNQAYSGEFQAQTEQGVIQGLATFLSFGGATYQILGYTSQARYNSYASQFDRTMSSFTTLTDPSALNIRPNRIDVVKAPTTMTYSQFNARYPSVVPINELLIINQLDNANERITAGTELKRVIVQQ